MSRPSMMTSSVGGALKRSTGEVPVSRLRPLMTSRPSGRPVQQLSSVKLLESLRVHGVPPKMLLGHHNFILLSSQLTTNKNWRPKSENKCLIKATVMSNCVPEPVGTSETLDEEEIFPSVPLNIGDEIP